MTNDDDPAITAEHSARWFKGFCTVDDGSNRRAIGDFCSTGVLDVFLSKLCESHWCSPDGTSKYCFCLKKGLTRITATLLNTRTVSKHNENRRKLTLKWICGVSGYIRLLWPEGIQTKLNHWLFWCAKRDALNDSSLLRRAFSISLSSWHNTRLFVCSAIVAAGVTVGR